MVAIGLGTFYLVHFLPIRHSACFQWASQGGAPSENPLRMLLCELRIAHGAIMRYLFAARGPVMAQWTNWNSSGSVVRVTCRDKC